MMSVLNYFEIEVVTFVAFLVGSSTIILSLLVKIVVEPDQIRRNFSRKSTEGLSPMNYTLGFLAYCSWIIHGLLRRDYVILISQSMGVLVTGIVLVQFFLYRRKNSELPSLPPDSPTANPLS